MRVEKRNRRGDFAITTDEPVNLFQAVKAHSLDLESSRGITPGADQVLDGRIEDVRRLLEWLSPAPEPRQAAFPAARTPQPSSFPTDQDQIPP
jgi:hypothetical protein